MAPSRGSTDAANDLMPPARTLTRSATPSDTAEAHNLQAQPTQNRYASPSDRLRPTVSREPSIRIRRPSAASIRPPSSLLHDGSGQTSRGRSSSEPRRPQLHLDVPGGEITKPRTTGSTMPAVAEESTDPSHILDPAPSTPPPARDGEQEMPRQIRIRPRPAARSARTAFGLRRGSARPGAPFGDGEYGSSAVDLLDVIDSEVSTLSTLTNVQNSLFIPNLGRLVNRRPEYELTPLRAVESDSSSEEGTLPPIAALPTETSDEAVEEATEGHLSTDTSRRRRFSISSQLDKSHYAVLPHLFSVEDWPEEDVKLLNDHVRHQLHSRRAKFKRSMRGFGKYVRKPLGFGVTLYATLITIFGLVWVLFIIGWLSAGERQPYVTHIVDSVLVGLFAIMGDGLAPFRAVDTYHMSFIAYYHHRTLRLRREKALPPLTDENDLPSAHPTEAKPETPKEEKGNDDNDIENASAFSGIAPHEISILKPAQQAKLEHHQAKFAKSHSFYKPHETTTHHAFPLHMLVAAVILLDCHSLLQIMLGSFTWGWSYHTRPPWITAVILSISITVNITAGIVISVGDRMTRKKEVVERMFRQALTEEGIKKLRKKKRREGAEERKGKVEGVEFKREHLHHPAGGSHSRGRFSLDIVGRHKSG